MCTCSMRSSMRKYLPPPENPNEIIEAKEGVDICEKMRSEIRTTPVFSRNMVACSFQVPPSMKPGKEELAIVEKDFEEMDSTGEFEHQFDLFKTMLPDPA